MNEMDEPVYSLSVGLPHGTDKVFGKREDLESVLRAWAAGECVTKVLVEGFCNTADRARMLYAFDPEEVRAMSVLMEF